MRTVLFGIPLWLPFVGSFKLPIYAYGTFMIFGLLAGLTLANWLFRRSNVKIKSDQILDLVVVAMFSGVLGARFLYVFRYMGSYIDSPTEIFKIWHGGLIFHGGILGGAIGVIWFLRRHKLPIRKTGDVLIPCLLLGLGFGRIGCFMNGCCFGKPSAGLPFAVHFPIDSPAYIKHLEFYPEQMSVDAVCSLPVHPTQIYSSIMASVLVFGLVVISFRRKFDGQVMALSAIAYGATRFFIEFFRDDIETVFLGFTMAQVISVVLFVGGIVIYWKWKKEL